MSEITHDIVIEANCFTVYKALTTADGLRSWFTTQVEGSGELGTDWKLQFTNQPFLDWQIVAVEDERKVIWKCVQGPGNSPGTQAEFKLRKKSDNACILTIKHQGWMKDDPKFEPCVEIWRTLMAHLQRYCETGIAAPVYN